MTDITEQMFKFKEAIRHTWNTYFLVCDSPMSPIVQEAFMDIERALLNVIVLLPLDAEELAVK